jgi:hypothetical protein
VVVVVSKEFISKPYPMEELQLLLHWQSQGSPAVMLPVFYHISLEQLGQNIAVYKLAAAGKRTPLQRAWAKEQWSKDFKMPTPQQLGQWAEDLGRLHGTTGVREDQVGDRYACNLQLLHVARTCPAACVVLVVLSIASTRILHCDYVHSILITLYSSVRRLPSGKSACANGGST